jgi:hypothetical protein
VDDGSTWANDGNGGFTFVGGINVTGDRGISYCGCTEITDPRDISDFLDRMESLHDQGINTRDNYELEPGILVPGIPKPWPGNAMWSQCDPNGVCTRIYYSDEEANADTCAMAEGSPWPVRYSLAFLAFRWWPAGLVAKEDMAITDLSKAACKR